MSGWRRRIPVTHPDDVAITSPGVLAGPAAAGNLKVILAKRTFAGPVSGADEALVTYAIHLHRIRCLRAVVLMAPPPHDDPYHARLVAAGVPVHWETTRRHDVWASRVLWGGLRLGASTAARLPVVSGRATSAVYAAWTAATRWLDTAREKRLARWLRRSGGTLLHVFTPDTGGVAFIELGASIGMPVLYHEMGTARFLPELTPAYDALRRVLPLCTEIAALSPTLAREWSDALGHTRTVSVVPLLMAPPPGTPVDRPAERPGVVFGYAARLERGKGPLVLVDALAMLHGPVETTAWMAGTGPSTDDVCARVRAHRLEPRCDLLGYITAEEKHARMLDLDVFVLPTLAEGTPNSLMEAMAYGLAIIASAVGGIPDMLGNDAALLVPPGDVGALAAAMQRLADDPSLRGQLGRAARARYETLFAPEAVIPLLIETYVRTAAQARPVLPTQETPAGAHPWSLDAAGDGVATSGIRPRAAVS